MLLLYSVSCFDLRCLERKPSVCYWFTCIDFSCQVHVFCSCLVLMSSSFKFQVSSSRSSSSSSFSFFCTRIQPGFILFHILCFVYSGPVSASTWSVHVPAPGFCSCSVLSSGSGSIWASSVGPDCYQGAPDILLISLYATFDYITNAIYINSIW